MTKLFIYNVNGTILEDTEAFGNAWRQAKALATEEHTCITRQVVCGNDICNEAYVTACCFLNEKYVTRDNIKFF